MLPTDPAARKAAPMCTGLLDYFPRALFEVARLSKAANERHNPGEALHWARHKSHDHPDALLRHLAERDMVDAEGFIGWANVAWRALAGLELALEARERGRPLHQDDGA